MSDGGKIVLVAGATGRAGRCLVGELLKRGYAVVRGDGAVVTGKAAAERAAQAEVLARLCGAAGVAGPTQLPEVEERAGWKRALQARLAAQREQLAQAATRPEEALREALAGLDAVAIDAARERCRGEVARLEQEQGGARQREEQTRRALEAIDASDAAARAREAMESAAARFRSAIRPWARLRLAHALLREALNRFRERAQAPMVAAVSARTTETPPWRAPMGWWVFGVTGIVNTIRSFVTSRCSIPRSSATSLRFRPW